MKGDKEKPANAFIRWLEFTNDGTIYFKRGVEPRSRVSSQYMGKKFAKRWRRRQSKRIIEKVFWDWETEKMDIKDPRYLDNLLLNMSGGLPPEYLSKNEVALMVERYGEDWLEKLGYTEPEYKKPNWEEGNED